MGAEQAEMAHLELDYACAGFAVVFSGLPQPWNLRFLAAVTIFAGLAWVSLVASFLQGFICVAAKSEEQSSFIGLASHLPPTSPTFLNFPRQSKCVLPAI